MTSFSCDTVAGVGTNLGWSVYYNGNMLPVGTTVGPTVTSYQGPSIQSIMSVGPTVMSALRTVGGDQIVLDGQFML